MVKSRKRPPLGRGMVTTRTFRTEPSPGFSTNRSSKDYVILRGTRKSHRSSHPRPFLGVHESHLFRLGSIMIKPLGYLEKYFIIDKCKTFFNTTLTKIKHDHRRDVFNTHLYYSPTIMITC